MEPKAMGPYGMAMLAFFNGKRNAQLIIGRDDGLRQSLPIAHFFREPSAFTAIENAALNLCSGPVLDVGAGSGLHSLELLKRGVSVTAIDINAQVVSIMRQRGVSDAHRADIFEYRGGPFGTILMMGHGIGVAETIAGLDRFLILARGLLSDDGQVLLESLDIRSTDDPRHVAYHEANRRAGRYIGETRLRVEYERRRGPYCGWLHLDADMLNERAEAAGWECDVIRQEKNGEYLARLAILSSEAARS